MRKTDEQLPIAWWRPSSMEEDVKGIDKVGTLLRERWPLGAVPLCTSHQWVATPDGHHHVCADCGLTVVR